LSICGREDAADLEVHVRTLEQELSAAERSRMEVEEAAASWDIEQALWALEHALFGGKRAVGRAVWKVSMSCGSWSTRSLLQRQETKLWAANGLRDLIQCYNILLFRTSLGLVCLSRCVHQCSRAIPRKIQGTSI